MKKTGKYLFTLFIALLSLPLVAQERADDYRFALRTNLLRWVTLTPDVGLEWRATPSWGILVNASWTSWDWSQHDRRYALWEVAPEVRHYVGVGKRAYVGAMYKLGEFNYKLNRVGRQGDLMGGGLTGGYQLRLNDALSLDCSLALGYLRADYEKYRVVEGVRVRQGEDAKNWWGPIHAGLTLTWNLFCAARRGCQELVGTHPCRPHPDVEPLLTSSAYEKDHIYNKVLRGGGPAAGRHLLREGRASRHAAPRPR